MNGITSRCISFAQGSSDCLQRVNYKFGLVLGVDEFVDEQCYFLEKEYQHNRSLHGYGTVSGLLVSVGERAEDIELQVERGMGIDQYGRVFIVRNTQCASLLSWLQDHPLEPGTRTIYVVARYSECETALVPIAGQPCATSDQLMAPSRLQDSFAIELVLEPPDHQARDAVVNLSEFLSRFRADPNAADLGDLGTAQRLVDIIGPLLITMAPNNFRTHIDQLVEDITGTAGATIIPIQPLVVEDMLNDIFTYWVTEVRPAVRPDLIDPDAPETAGGPIPPAEILLAEVHLVIPATGLPAPDAITIDNTTRPYLLHTQLIQELFDVPDLAGEGGGVPARELHQWATITDVGPRGLSLWLHIGRDLGLQPNENIRLLRVRPNGDLEQVTIDLAEEVARRNEVGRYYRIRTFVNLENGDFLLFRFDTTQIQVDGAGTLTDFIAAAPFTYPNYQPGPGRLFAFHVVDRGQTGVTEERVREIIRELMQPQEPVIPFVTVTPLTEGNQAFAYELWFHLDGIAEQNEGKIERLDPENFAFYVEPMPNAVEQIPVEFEQLRDNVWHVFPAFGNQRTRSLVRMAFALDMPIGIQAFNPVAGGLEFFETLREYIDKSDQRLEGQLMATERFGEALVVFVREQASARRLPL
jgi:hypothetical protein